MILSLAFKSARNRRLTATLTVLSIAFSVALLLGVERIRHQAREGFESTVSGTDLVVGARTSPVHLLLHSVFRIGDATANLRWDSYRRIASLPEVAWTIPLSLGDSHRGFRVLGTTQAYFDHLEVARDRRIVVAAGSLFEHSQDAVLGADVAKSLGYAPGREIVIAHGSGDVAFSLHQDHPFRVTGILARTGTPVDRTIHVPLEGVDALHAAPDAHAHDPLRAGRRATRPADGHRHDEEHAIGEARDGPQDRTLTAFLVGLKSRGTALHVQRLVNEYPGEPLTAILPGVTLLEVWEIVGMMERALLAVSVLVVVVGLLGMLVALLTSLGERRREMAVLRSVGARPLHVFVLIVGEAVLLTAAGIALGVALLYGGIAIGQPWLESRLGLFIEMTPPTLHEAGLMMLMACAGACIGLVPGYRSYRQSLADGMTIRL